MKMKMASVWHQMALRWEKKRGNWRITEYRIRPEPGAQSFEQVFRFDKEAKPMRWF
jgi:hypothetical protein